MLGDNCDGAAVVGVVSGEKGDYAAAAENVKKKNQKNGCYKFITL